MKFADILLNYKQSVYEDKILNCKKIFIDEWKKKNQNIKRKIQELSQLKTSQNFMKNLQKHKKLCLHEEDKHNLLDEDIGTY